MGVIILSLLPLYLFDKAFAATPTATIVVADELLTSGETSMVTITFSEAVTGFDLADLETGSGILSGLTTSDNITYSATLTPPLSNHSGPFNISLNHSGIIAGGNVGSGTTVSNHYYVDTVMPIVTSVSVPANGTYGAGEDLSFTVNMNEIVVVTGIPTIPLIVGTTTVYANYVSGSGTNALQFRYTIQTGQSDTNGITIGALSLNGGSIRDEAGNDAVLTLNSVGSTAGVLVDAISPTITSVSPTLGSTSGGTTVTLTGTNLTDATAVKFGATEATSYTVNSATQITAIAPAGSAGTVDVTVTTPGGTSTTSAADQYTYHAEPTITSVSPTSGPTTGGTAVTLTGTNLTDATEVMFGATEATSYTVNSATQITAIAPAGSAGTVDVTVTTPGGTSTTSAANQYTYHAAPTITSMSPVSGPTTGGTTVTLSGTNLTDATAVKFGATAATSYTVNSATQITAIAPAGSAGTVDVTVTTPGGTSTTSAANQYTYHAAPTITSMSPVSGPTTGGTTVTLSGTNLTDATAVKFGATAATSYTVNSATQITAIAPAGSTGTVDVTVTTPGGTSTTSAANQFTWFVVTHAISPLSDETLNALTAGYASGTQATKTVTLTRTGTGDLTSLATALGGTNAGSFTITQPTVTTLNSGTPSTTFTVKANDGLAAGTYKATVTVSAGGMTPVTFTVTQVVNSSSNNSSGGSGNSSSSSGGTTPVTSTHSDIDQNGIMIDWAKIDSSKPSVTLEITPKDGVAYVRIPASILTSIEGKNATFFIEIKTPYGSYQVPVNLASLIPGLKDLLAKNNVNNDDISFKITLTDKSGDKDFRAAFANSLPNGHAMGAIVDFHIDIINTKTGQAIGTADKFSKALTREILMPKSMTGMPAQWGAFRYNVTTKKLEFVAAEKKQIDGKWVVKIKSYSNSVYVVAQNTVSFADVQQHWSKSDVDLAAAKGLVEGVGGGLYDPNKAVTRAEFTAMLVRALGRGASDKDIAPYNDVKPGTWYSGEVSTAKELGLLTFVKGNSFTPNQPLTREEMASMLAAVGRLEQLPISKEPVSLNGFKDIGNADTAYIEDVHLMVKLHIMTGTGANTFDPKGETTRAQAAVVFIRMLRTLGSIDR
ncbi:IPT/TIG domain-containing protein [Paenibacillus sp. FSL W7-1088]|uniref:IPT/TIG domain-containing protein n=1 Tax=Paenibacillus sp. FSL W7-1088 TaxID=2921695 RepID=UPI0030EBD21F